MFGRCSLKTDQFKEGQLHLLGLNENLLKIIRVITENLQNVQFWDSYVEKLHNDSRKTNQT